MQVLSRLLIVFAALAASVSVRATQPYQYPIFTVEVATPQGKVTYLTLVDSSVFMKSGLPPEAIVGQLLDGTKEITSANFARNRVFVDYMHSFIAAEGPADGELRGAARRVRNGELRVLDRRAKGDEPAEEDVVGTFQIVDGTLTTYTRNPKHRILGDRGLFRLPQSLEKKLVEALARKALATK